MEYNSYTDSFSSSASTSAASSNLAQPTHAQPSADVGRGGVEFRQGSGSEIGTTSRSTGVSVSAEDFITAQGIEGTIRTSSGGVVMNRGYHGSDTIDVGGIRCSMKVAETLGVTVRNPDGSYTLATAHRSPQGAATGQSGGNPQGKPEGLGDASEGPAEAAPFQAPAEALEAMAEIRNAVPAPLQFAAFEAILNTGEVSPDMIAAMARASSSDPEAVMGVLNAAHEGFYNEVSQRMESQGVHDEDLFRGWVEGDPGRMRQMQGAVRNLMTRNDASGFDAVAQEFVQSLDVIDPESVGEALTASGIPFKTRSNGVMVLTIPGKGEMTFREAVKTKAVHVLRD